LRLNRPIGGPMNTAITRHPLPYRVRRVAAVVAALGLTLGATEAGRASAGTEDWKQSPLPVSDATIITMAQPDQHTTWAAGATVTVQGRLVTLNPLLMAKDERTGQGWKVVSIPDDTTYNRINAISVHGPDEAWLVGDNDTRAGSANAVLTEHWDGTA